MLDLELNQIIIQIIAFLIMLWVMKRFGWKPLLHILEERRTKIQNEFASIDQRKEELATLFAGYEEKVKTIENEKRKKIQEGIAIGQQINREIQEEAQARAKQIVHRAKSEMTGEIETAKKQLKEEMITLVLSLTEKLLQEELDEPKQKKLIVQLLNEAELQ